MTAALAHYHSAFSPTDVGEAATSARGQGGIRFTLFLLLNAVLFIRPGEILPALEGWPIYNVVMLGCLLTSLPVVIRQLSPSHLKSHPGILAVLAMLPAIMLSQIFRGDFYTARMGATDFLKVIIYFLLLTGLVNSPARLGRFLFAIVLFIIAIAGIAALNFHGVIQVAGIEARDRAMGEDQDGNVLSVVQLYGPGIFNDPNDLSLILSAALLILIHFAFDTRSWVRRFVLLAACVIPGYAFALTNSRGGFLAFASGMGVLCVSRFGWKRSMPLALVGLPLMLVLFGGRMTNISFDEDDTGHGRIMIWRDGFVVMKSSPIFGIGYDEFAEEMGHVAHNSFVHAFTELGLVGGTIFTAAFYIPISTIRRVRPHLDPNMPDSLVRWRPILLAILTSYVIGLCSLTRCYTISTYMILGLCAAYCAILGANPPMTVVRLDAAYLRRLILVGLSCLIFFNVCVRAF